MRRIAADPERIDWFRVLTDLGRHGIPITSVASITGIPKSTVLGWKEGAEPKFIDGDRLLDLWIGVTGNNRHKAPRARPFA